METSEELNMTADEDLQKQEQREDKLFQRQLEKQFEDTRFCTADEMKLPQGNSTGSLALDISLTVPFYEGAIHEIFSDSGAGKTTLALSILAEAVKKGKKVLFLDQEDALQSTLVESFPALREPGTLKVITAPTGEDALRIAELWALQYPRCVIVIDSVDALLPQQTEGKAIGETDVGTLPKLMSAGCRKLQAAVGKSDSTIVFINQVRTNIGAYGDPDTTSGGRALPFYAAQRIKLMNITAKTRVMNEDGDQVGHLARYKIIKNKVAPPFVTGEFPLIYGKGIDMCEELVTLAGDFGVIEMDKKNYLVPNAKGVIVRKPKKTVVDMMRGDPVFYAHVLLELKELYPETFGE